jgi:cytosine/adenosine deaminase-related metal-dependent hydrolase
MLGGSGTGISYCATTERDLADGIGPVKDLFDAGCSISIGSDQHVVIDPFEEARGVESHTRLASRHRGRFTPAQLIDAMTRAGQCCLGWPDAGTLEVGARADLVAVRLDTVRTAGIDPAQVVMAATAADVHTVIVDGRLVVEQGRHRLGDIGRQLAEAIAPLWP